jgi:hypothetical protein
MVLFGCYVTFEECNDEGDDGGCKLNGQSNAFISNLPSSFSISLSSLSPKVLASI